MTSSWAADMQYSPLSRRCTGSKKNEIMLFAGKWMELHVK
jgi:hypothetical protein